MNVAYLVLNSARDVNSIFNQPTDESVVHLHSGGGSVFVGGWKASARENQKRAGYK